MSSNTGHILAIYVFGDKLDKYNNLHHEEREARLGNDCLDMIKKIFPVCRFLLLVIFLITVRWSMCELSGDESSGFMFIESRTKQFLSIN